MGTRKIQKYITSSSFVTCRRHIKEHLSCVYHTEPQQRPSLFLESVFLKTSCFLCVLQQFCGVLGHTFMEFLKGSGDYCQAQHAAYADEWTAKLAIDPTHLSHRRDPGKLAGPGRLPEPATTRPGWGNSTRCTLPSSASAWPESRWNQPCFFFFFLPFLSFYSKGEGFWVVSLIVRPFSAARSPNFPVCPSPPSFLFNLANLEGRLEDFCF